MSPLLVAIVLVSFLLVKSIAGDPVALMLGPAVLCCDRVTALPDVTWDKYHIDILTAHFVLHLDWFDVVAAANLFDHLGEKTAAADIARAIEQVLAEPALCTRDLDGRTDTVMRGKAIAQAIG